MTVVLAGASGLIGKPLSAALRADGHEVVALVRREARGPYERRWDPAEGLDPALVSGAQAVVCLSGAGVGDRRWDDDYKREILDSRVRSTASVATAVATAEQRPPVLISASAVGFYGDTGAEQVDESAPAGSGFLADVCERWEAAARPASDAGVRVVTLRTGLVLSADGGLLKRLVPIFRLGGGGRLGSGKQYFPWISLRDELAAIRFALSNDAVHGPLNLTAPNPVTNAEFTRALARQLHRPVMPPVPAFALRMVLGEFAGEVLAGQRAIPGALIAAGFSFADTDIAEAVRAALG